MPGTAPLSVPVQVTLDGSGSGTASAGPTGSGEAWSAITASVHCSTAAAEATCRVYAGADASARYFCDGTYAGSSGDSTTNLPPAVPPGQRVWAVWTGGDPGATAYLTLTGTRTVP